MNDTQAICGAVTVVAAAVAPAIKAGSDLAVKLLGEPCESLGGLFAGGIREFKVENLKKIFVKAAEKITVVTEIPPKAFMVPFVEAVQNVEDENLQDMWAELLASAAQDETAQQVRYVNVLSQMDAADAELFRRFAVHHRPLFPGDTEQGYATRDRLLGMALLQEHPDQLGTRSGVPVTRTGILRNAGPSYMLSTFGRLFAKAVMGPKEKAADRVA
jgi:hypothetical protein